LLILGFTIILNTSYFIIKNININENNPGNPNNVTTNIDITLIGITILIELNIKFNPYKINIEVQTFLITITSFFIILSPQ
jgi:hypothetical protein